MKINYAFRKFDEDNDPDWFQVAVARSRIDQFASTLKSIDSGIKVIGSGSWARGTSLGPLHDVDLILVLPSKRHSEMETGSGSAAAALGYVADHILEYSGRMLGFRHVHRAEPRNHVVKCYVDTQLTTDDPGWRGFAVEVMPAFRDGSALRVPEKHEDRWRTVDPEYLLAATERRQREWPEYKAMVRLLKAWARDHPELKISSLAMEALALKHLPHPPVFGTLSRVEALTRFFTAAADAVMSGVHDPAGLCGEIAPDLRRWKTREVFREMADLAATAAAWEKSKLPHGEDIAVHFLRKIFGKKFPKPSRNWDDVGLPPWLESELGRLGPRVAFHPEEMPPIDPEFGDKFRATGKRDRPRPDDPGERFDGPGPPPPDPPEGGPDSPGGAGPDTPSGGSPRTPRAPSAPGRQRPHGAPVRLTNPHGHRQTVLHAAPIVAPVVPRAEDPAG